MRSTLAQNATRLPDRNWNVKYLGQFCWMKIQQVMFVCDGWRTVCVFQEELYLQRVAQLDEVTTERDRFKRAYEDLRKRRLNEFMMGFNIITNKLKENYQMLTLGGDAELELVDSLDPFSEGIMFR